jgi:hypothetical protein
LSYLPQRVYAGNSIFKNYDFVENLIFEYPDLLTGISGRRLRK